MPNKIKFLFAKMCPKNYRYVIDMSAPLGRRNF